MTAPLVFLDTETTGLHPGRNAWEVAMIRRWAPDGQEQTLSFFIDIADLDLADADPFALSIGKFWERHPQMTGERYLWTNPLIHGTARSSGGIAEANQDFLTVLSAADACKAINHFTAGAHVVGAVPHFDTETLDRLLRAHNWLPRWHYHLIDVENLAIGYLNAQISMGDMHGHRLELVRNAVQPPWDSHELGEILGVEQPEESRHTALGDATWARDMYERVTVQ